MLVTVIAFVGGLALFFKLESSFFPDYDKGEFQLNFQTAPDASLDETQNRVRAVLSVLKAMPEVKHTYTTIGAGDTGTVRDAKVYVKLVDRGKRKLDQEEVQRTIRTRLHGIAGIIPSIEEADGFHQKPVMVSIRGDRIDQLKKYVALLKDEMYGIRGIVDLEVSLEQEIPEYRLTVDRERAADSGVNTNAIVQTVGALVGGQAVTTYEDDDGDAVDVRVRLPQDLRQDLSQVKRLQLSVQRMVRSPHPWCL
jgi:hydrophobic/amphiphilic exporter-1 (mainly G- bacteria), HAE1 family